MLGVPSADKTSGADGADGLEAELANLDKYDPLMEEAASTFNAYENLENDQQPYSRQLARLGDHQDDGMVISKPYRIHVSNIGRLNETGIRNLFKPFGNVVEVYIRKYLFSFL